ncbi:DUF1254 domain-containing protein [Variovorax dokdonensis]|uniref:DUF1254 domain-containing protein n=1 Tax=Variovorax dokdonensis TaxID=344883 RepID=A0ABT7NGL7_9BURK|nr:DUF1254 domain-containing protein [Variovorax dokdonensis]MDM0047098.1 DUF1254 domain-containing protein [Variovorax dokdonensis]
MNHPIPTSHPPQSPQPNAQAAWVMHAAVPAMVAGYALLEAVRTCALQTAPGATAYGRAPFNHLGRSEQRWTDRDRDIVTPANDLLYSNAWIDLRRGPVVITVPRQTGRYFVLELMDIYTNNFHNIGTRNVPAEGGRFALMHAQDTSEPPIGSTVIRSPSSLVWLLGRVLVDDEADLPAARAFQAGFALQGSPAPQPPASVAQWQQGGDAALDFVANLARALHDFPPPPSQLGVFEALAGAHVPLRADGKLDGLRPGMAEALRQAHETALCLVEAHTRSHSRAPWRFSSRLGRYGDDLMLRAATAFKGLGALAVDEAVYAMTDFDHEGEPLHGRHTYRIRFEDGGALPADAFWSITLYGKDRYLAANAIGRHALGNRSQLQQEPDGSLVLHVSHAPAPGPQANWLPAPDGPFYLILRMYHPQQRLFDGHYLFPAMERLA